MATLESVKKQRVALRTQFSKAVTNIEAELAQGSDISRVQKVFRQLEDRATLLFKRDDEILSLMASEDTFTNDDYDKEMESQVKYRNTLIAKQAEVQESLMPTYVVPQENVNRKFKLPSLEITKFDGNVKSWLGFWGQFVKIHDDKQIPLADKFQYLLQSTEPGSKAREICETFPATADSYLKLVDQLKDRFGRSDILVEVYVRELLGLVANAIHPRQKTSLSNLYDKLESQLRALESLGVTTDKYSVLLNPLVESCLPEDLLRAWERKRVIGQNVNLADRLKQLMEFLREEVAGEERIMLARTGFGVESKTKLKVKYNKTDCDDTPTVMDLLSVNDSGKSKIICIFCGKNHVSQDCFKVATLSLEDKKKMINEKRACFQCLKPGHFSRRCKTKLKCQLCSGRHYIVLCPELNSCRREKNKETGSAYQLENKDQLVVNESASNSLAVQDTKEHVLLQTLIVRLLGNGKEKNVRAVIDTGSQNTYVLEKTVKSIGINPVGQERLSHILFGAVTSEQNVHNRYNLTVCPLNRLDKFSFEALDQPIICGKISRLKGGSIFNELRNQNIILTDLGESCPEIELLIGSDVVGNLLTGRVVKLKSGPVAVETKLGWTIMGKVPDSCVGSVALTITSLFVNNASLSELWDLETIGIRDPIEKRAKEELHEDALDHFNKTVIVNAEGRYEIHLPWILSHPELPSNRYLTEKRLLSTTRKLQQSGLLQEYNNIFKEWQIEGVIERVCSEEHDLRSHYLPHRAVVKESSETTRVRPVFDASARANNFPSLNDCLEQGPNLLELIPELIIQFRKYRYGVTADIRKAFLQISITPHDRNFLKFFWWKNLEKSDVVVYRHQRVVFGITCSPFLLSACISHHLKLVTGELKQTADKLKSAFYVDNCLTSVSTIDDLKRFISNSSEIMASAQFELRGWKHTRYLDNDIKISKTNLLGLLWDTDDDSLSCNVPDFSENVNFISKRSMLSVSHKLFDPIGFMCPILLLPKILLKETWGLKIGWDEKLPISIYEKFRKWLTQLVVLKTVKIPRWLASDCCESVWSLHVFADASQHAYAACVFVRIESENGVSVQLVQAKSRVSPMKRASIPRLELVACCIATRLLQSVKKGLDMNSIRVEYWSDSMDALYWIKTDAQWGTFVWNRVKEIRSVSSPTNWHHVPGNMNPADLPSRGCTPRQLITSHWWTGPNWLYQPENQWPAASIVYNKLIVDQERKKSVAALAVMRNQENFSDVLCRHVSRYSCIVGIIARLYRLTGLTKNLRDENNILGVAELKHAEKRLLLLVQKEAFGEKNLDSLKRLNVFQDEEGFLRVKTKLLYRDDLLNFKCPMVLPSRHPIVSRIILEKHRQICHAGVNILMSILREEFWILRSRKTIRRVLDKCGKCRRFTSRPYYIETAPLPPERVNTAKVFEIVGVDLAGPLYLKGSRKSWIVLYTCAVYRAIHLELVTSVSTVAFLESFRRFISRRGRPSIVYSDNGRNFTGASEAMKRLDWTRIIETTALKRIQWKFNPPYAAWWGGWWERLIRIVKDLLKRILGKSVLFYDELYTILCDCEAIVNSRPLTYVSEDGGDLIALTPAMFLNDTQGFEVFDLNQIDAVNLEKRTRYMQSLRNALRDRFRNEYLGLLVAKANKKQDDIIHPNTVVLIGNNKTKRINWPLARVLETFLGRDGKTRVARLRTKGGECLRAVQCLYPLELPREDMLTSKVCSGAIKENVPTVDIANCSNNDGTGSIVTTRSGRLVRASQRLNLFTHLH